MSCVGVSVQGSRFHRRARYFSTVNTSLAQSLLAERDQYDSQHNELQHSFQYSIYLCFVIQILWRIITRWLKSSWKDRSNTLHLASCYPTLSLDMLSYTNSPQRSSPCGSRFDHVPNFPYYMECFSLNSVHYGSGIQPFFGLWTPRCNFLSAF
jgi:hypothetical protein